MHSDHERSHGDAISDLTQAEGAAVDNASKWHFYNYVSWPVLASKLKRRFQRCADEARRTMRWEALYVLEDYKYRTVQLFFGKHVVHGIPNNDIEIGASLVVSQGVDGSVVVMFFPFESTAHVRSKKKLIWTYYDCPQRVSDGEIAAMLRDFFVYGRVTSALLSCSRRERRHIDRLEHRSRILEGGGERQRLQTTAMVALIVGSIATVLLFVAWLVKGDGTYEPMVGLVALGTGWIAASVQRARQSLDRQIGRAMDTEESEQRVRRRRDKAKKRR